MQIEIAPRSRQIERPSYVWIAVILEILTGILAVPVGWSFLQDPTGKSLGIPQGWIESTVVRELPDPGPVPDRDERCSRCSPRRRSPFDATGSHRG